jgi:tetratricopeptide (TPR) repeat protein
MRAAFAIPLLILLAGQPALAAEQEVPPAEPQLEQAKPAENKQTRIDNLFGQLKRERNEKAAERVAGQIWEQWFDSGSSSIDLMMQWSQKAVEEQKYDVALDFLDEVIMLSPDYAEGWNRRATLHFMMSNYAKSMSDIDHTLALEPRHFGALSGMAQILRNTGKKESALRAWQRVLDIYPMMRNAQNEVATLSEELAGESI